MKTDDKIREYRSNVVGTAVRMGIAEGAEAHLMDVLTKMYSDPELACIREYSTNARDSHIEAGQTRPIEVTLPTPYLPTLVIRDYGIGLNEEGIRELYSQYGASTKRGTNSAQGMLGIGCKSALAYTDQFTIVGYKDGVRTQVVISRDEDGAATQTIVGVDYGQHEDGVEVTIPVKADNDIEDKAHNFFRFWPKGSVLLNPGAAEYEPRPVGSATGEDAEGNDLRNIWLDDRTLLTNEVDEDLVVMGYVAYPLVDGDDALFKAPRQQRRYDPKRGYVYGSGFNAVCFVDIGEVNFAPSREALQATKRTKTKLDELRQHVADSFDASVRAQIAGAKDAKEAQELLIAGKEMGFTDTPAAQWQGKDVLLELKRGKPQKDYNGNPIISTGGVEDWPVEDCLKWSYLFANSNAYTRKTGEREGRLDLQGDFTIFTGFDGKWLTDVKRAKQDLWAQNKGVTVKRAVYLDKLTEAEKFWTSGWPVYDWAEVDATELPKTTTANGDTVRLKGSYDCLVDGTREPMVPAHQINTKKPLYWVQGNSWAVAGAKPLRTGAITKEGATIVALSANRVAKFCRDFPMAVELHAAAKAAAEKWQAKIDSDQVKAYAIKTHRSHALLRALKGKDFDDPTLNTLVRLANTSCASYEAGLNKYGAWASASTSENVRKLIEAAVEKYPLAPWHNAYGVSGKALEHTVLYINAAIAAGKE